MPLDGFEEVTTHTPEELAQAHVVQRALATSSVAAPIKSPELQRATGFSGPLVRALVNILRQEGVAVCSSSQGYFLARSPEELDVSISHLEQRARSITRAALGLKRCKARMVEEQPPAKLELGTLVE